MKNPSESSSRKEGLYRFLGLIVAITSCIANWLALPQIQTYLRPTPSNTEITLPSTTPEINFVDTLSPSELFSPSATPFPEEFVLDATSFPKFTSGQILKVQVSGGSASNTWTEPDVTIGVRYQIISQGTFVKIIDVPAFGSIVEDKSVSGWWYPIMLDGRKVWIIEDNLEIP